MKYCIYGRRTRHSNAPPAESAQRITPTDVERTKAEKKAAYTALMDQMEASVETQGQYFVRVGQKVPITEVQSETRSRFMGLKKESFPRDVEVGFDDQRVLILNADEYGKYNDYSEGATTPRETRELTMITPDGIKTLQLKEDGIDKDKRLAETIDKLRAGRQPTPGSGFVRLERSNALIRIGYLPDPKQYDVNTAPGVENISAGLYGEAQQFAGSAEDFQERIQKSIAKTEAPHKKAFEETSAQTELANSAAEMVRTLPPRA